jgi:PH (Pleckstrin Homology) domain-containing protein
MQWRIKPVLPVTKGMGAVAVVVLAVAFAGRDPVRWALALVVALALVIWVVRDLIAPVRLAADAAGVTVVTGFARRRHLPWAQIERVRVDVTSRRGLRSELLELDAGESIFLFSAHELGVLPDEVATALADLRTSPS